MIRHLAVVIDHHPIGTVYRWNFARDVTASATGELVHDIIMIEGALDQPHGRGHLYRHSHRYRRFRLTMPLRLSPGDFRGCGKRLIQVMHNASLGRREFAVIGCYSSRWLLLNMMRSMESWMIIPRDRYEEVGASAEDLEDSLIFLGRSKVQKSDFFLG